MTFTRGLSEESHFSCLVMVKKKLGNCFDQQSKSKESKEQMGSFVLKTAKSVLAFCVLRTVVLPYIDIHTHFQRVLGYLLCSFRKPFCSKLREKSLLLPVIVRWNCFI